MFDDTRYLTSVVYLTCLVATIVLVFLPVPSGPKLFFLLALTVSQFAASTWYSLSYIPYGRRTALRFIKRSLGIEEERSPSYTGIGQMMGISLGSGSIS
jgi:Got1/Sft2-like family